MRYSAVPLTFRLPLNFAKKLGPIELNFYTNLADIPRSDIGLLMFRFFQRFKMAVDCMDGFTTTIS